MPGGEPARWFARERLFGISGRLFQILAAAACIQTAAATQTPTNLVTCVGDASIVLHWDPVVDPALSGYNVYRSTASSGPFVLQNTSLLPSPGFCDLFVMDGTAYYYQVTAVDSGTNASAVSSIVSAVPKAFANNDQLLDYIEQTDFDFFWDRANPVNGLIPDRSETSSPCSIASVGFGLTAIGIAIDHGWITRTQG